jgi:hypothetical protein
MATPRLVIPGIVKNGLVVPQNDTPLPEGTHVDILIGPAEMTPELQAELAQWEKGECLIVGGHAAIGWGTARNPGYHSRKVASQSPFKTRVRICSSRCAPRGVQAICCFLQKRLLIT